MRRLLAITLFFLSFTCRRAECESLFLPPANLALYSKSKGQLSSSEQWKIKIFGLRMAPLHPQVWGMLAQDRTENRRLVPIRPFYLRDSEDPNFALQSIKFKFKFKQTGLPSMLKNAHFKESVFDIGIGGEYVKDKGVDRGYVLRFSAYPPLESGLYYRSRSKFLLLKKFDFPFLQTGVEYNVNFQVDGSVSILTINDQVALSYQGDLKTGLVSIITGWNPLTFKNLEIVAMLGTQLLTYSGLHEIK